MGFTEGSINLNLIETFRKDLAKTEANPVLKIRCDSQNKWCEVPSPGGWFFQEQTGKANLPW